MHSATERSSAQIIDDMSTMIAIDVAYSARVGVIKLLPVSRTLVDTTSGSYRLMIGDETYTIIGEKD